MDSSNQHCGFSIALEYLVDGYVRGKPTDKMAEDLDGIPVDTSGLGLLLNLHERVVYSINFVKRAQSARVWKRCLFCADDMRSTPVADLAAQEITNDERHTEARAASSGSHGDWQRRADNSLFRAGFHAWSAVVKGLGASDRNRLLQHIGLGAGI